MAIPDALETRLVDRIAWFFRSNPTNADFFELYGGTGTPTVPTKAARVRIGSYATYPAGATIIPPQMNIYVGNSGKDSGVGNAWPTEVEVTIEHFSAIGEWSTEAGVRASFNEAKEIVNRLYVGESPLSPGRFKDPTDLAVWLTTSLMRVAISEPRIGVTTAGVLRFINATFSSRENVAGVRT